MLLWVDVWRFRLVNGLNQRNESPNRWREGCRTGWNQKLGEWGTKDKEQYHGYCQKEAEMPKGRNEGNMDVSCFVWGAPDGLCLSLGIQIHYIAMCLPSTYTHNQTHEALLPHAAYLDNYLPQVLVHRDTPRTCCHRGHCARESRRQPFRGQWGEKEVEEWWWCVSLCVGRGVWWVFGGIGENIRGNWLVKDRRHGRRTVS